MAVILLITRAVELGDTVVYANDIVAYLGKSPVGPGNSLWEFGHLLWRPLGWAVLSVTSGIFAAWTNWTPVMQASFVLITLSVFSALIAVVLWYSIALRASGSKSIAFLIATAMACSHGVLLYSHSGCAYIPGLSCLTASLYFQLAGRTRTAAIFFALAASIWFPFILAGAALLLLAAFPPEPSIRPSRPFFGTFDRVGAIRFISVSAVVLLLAYGLAIYARQISSVRGFMEWYSAAGHGLSQTGRLLRMVTGLPRSLLYLGKDGILYKRFLKHDPYAAVTLGDLVSSSFWKLGAYYLFVACFGYEMLRRPRTGGLLALIAAGTLPVIFFAVFIFEPSSPERYLPFFPFIVLGMAWVLRDFAVNRRFTQVVIAAFLGCVVVANGYSFFAPRVLSQNDSALSRVAGLRSRLNSGGLVMVATNQDELGPTLSRLVFDNINRPAPLPVYDIIEASNSRVLTWRQELAARALKAWANGGEVWISRRLWSSVPEPSWNWVEGDDPRVSWKDVPGFFAKLNTDAESGGADGFLRLARNEDNLALLTSLADSPPVPTKN